MKKMWICCGVLCMAFLLFCGSAMAADLTAEVTQVDTSVSVEKGTKDGAFDGTYKVKKESGVSDGQLYLVLLMSGTEANPKPTAQNVYYMNVVTASGASVECDAYPRDMEKGTYTVYLSDYAANSGAAKTAATITVAEVGGINPDYTLGDVDGVDGITPADALLAAQIAAKTVTVEDWQKLAADVDKKEGVTPTDALFIQQKAAFPELDFSKFQ